MKITVAPVYTKIRSSLKSIHYRLYFALLILALVPTVYTTFRTYWIGQLPDLWSFSIAGQLSWVNLLYEVLKEAIILPLFFFIGQVKDNKNAFANTVRTGLLISLGAYAFLSSLLILFADPLLSLMAVDPQIINETASYIRIESIANVFSILTQFILVALVSLNKSKYLYAITATQFILTLATDAFLISTLPYSLNLGVNGIGCSNILVNAVLLLLSFHFLSKEGICIWNKEKPDFAWLKTLFSVGGISGIESLVRNLAYMVMISRMVNIVGEQGTYWVANNFIWNWLLLPVLQLGELIKQEIADSKDNIRKNTLGYFILTGIISILWLCSIPLWRPFLTVIVGSTDIDKLFSLILLLFGFYIPFAFQNVFDATFYGLGKTKYMLFESVVTNTVYYGIAFLLYLCHLWTPTLMGIALLFGIGNLFDSIVSLLAYRHLLKKEHIQIL